MNWEKLKTLRFSIEEMQEAEYKPGWKKELYPTMEMLREALEKGELYIGEEEWKDCIMHDLKPNL